MSNEIFKRILSSIALIFLSFYCIINGSYFFNFMLAIIFLLSSLEWNKMSKKKSYHLLGFLYLIFSLFCVYQLRFSFTNDASLFIFITLLCILTDTGGFIFGKIFKGPKLTKYSPNKTYSGLLGSFILSLFLIPLNIFFNLIEKNTYIELTFFILIVSGASQMGDIFISYFKRIAKIKDTGNLIPGHGGLLDRIDGMLFAFPIAYLLIYFNFFLIYK